MYQSCGLAYQTQEEYEYQEAIDKISHYLQDNSTLSQLNYNPYNNYATSNMQVQEPTFNLLNYTNNNEQNTLYFTQDPYQYYEPNVQGQYFAQPIQYQSSNPVYLGNESYLNCGSDIDHSSNSNYVQGVVNGNGFYYENEYSPLPFCDVTKENEGHTMPYFESCHEGAMNNNIIEPLKPQLYCTFNQNNQMKQDNMLTNVLRKSHLTNTNFVKNMNCTQLSKPVDIPNYNMNDTSAKYASYPQISSVMFAPLPPNINTTQGLCSVPLPRNNIVPNAVVSSTGKLKSLIRNRRGTVHNTLLKQHDPYFKKRVVPRTVVRGKNHSAMPSMPKQLMVFWPCLLRGVTLRCRVCGIRCPTPLSLSTHMKFHQQPFCLACFAVFKDTAGRDYHIRKFHGEGIKRKQQSEYGKSSYIWDFKGLDLDSEIIDSPPTLIKTVNISPPSLIKTVNISPPLSMPRSTKVPNPKLLNSKIKDNNCKTKDDETLTEVSADDTLVIISDDDSDIPKLLNVQPDEFITEISDDSNDQVSLEIKKETIKNNDESFDCKLTGADAAEDIQQVKSSKRQKRHVRNSRRRRNVTVKRKQINKNNKANTLQLVNKEISSGTIIANKSKGQMKQKYPKFEINLRSRDATKNSDTIIAIKDNKCDVENEKSNEVFNAEDKNALKTISNDIVTMNVTSKYGRSRRVRMLKQDY